MPFALGAFDLPPWRLIRYMINGMMLKPRSVVSKFAVKARATGLSGPSHTIRGAGETGVWPQAADFFPVLVGRHAPYDGHEFEPPASEDKPRFANDPCQSGPRRLGELRNRVASAASSSAFVIATSSSRSAALRAALAVRASRRSGAGQPEKVPRGQSLSRRACWPRH